MASEQNKKKGYSSNRPDVTVVGHLQTGHQEELRKQKKGLHVTVVYVTKQLPRRITPDVTVVYEPNRKRAYKHSIKNQI